jgi:hypothetical protein
MSYRSFNQYKQQQQQQTNSNKKKCNNPYYISSSDSEDDSNERILTIKKNSKTNSNSSKNNSCGSGSYSISKKVSFSDRNDLKVYEIEVDINGRVPRLRSTSYYINQNGDQEVKTNRLEKVIKKVSVIKKEKVEKVEKRIFNIRTDSWASFEFSDSDSDTDTDRRRVV